MTNWKTTTGYTLATMRCMARRYEIPGRSKMNGHALYRAIIDAMRVELENNVKNVENLREGALFRNTCGCVMVAMSDVRTSRDIPGRYVRALWVEPCGHCSEGGSRSAEDLNKEQDRMPRGYEFSVSWMSEVLDTTDKVAKILKLAADIVETDGTSPNHSLVYATRAVVADIFLVPVYLNKAIGALYQTPRWIQGHGINEASLGEAVDMINSGAISV